jgi:hypothetical protein
VDAQPSYPAYYNTPYQINVASINSDGTMSSFSNYGAQRVHIGERGGG